LWNAAHFVIFTCAIAIMADEIGMICIQNGTVRTHMLTARHRCVAALVSIIFMVTQKAFAAYL
jgi:hypothetical protein